MYKAENIFLYKKRLFSAGFFVAILLLSNSPVFSVQTAKALFDQYTIRDGLSHNTVNCIVQDSFGFMWFGTMDGLSRFDGNQFKVFKSVPEDPNSLCHSLVKSLCLDKHGNLWIGTSRGLSFLDLSTNRFIHYSAQDSSRLSHNNIEMVFCDSRGVIWVATQGGGLNKFDSITETFSRFRADRKKGSLSNDNVHWIFEDKKGTLWVGTEGGGLNRLQNNTAEPEFDYFQFEPEDGNYQALNCVRSIQQDYKGNIWVGTWGGGVAMLDEKKGKFHYYRHSNNDKGVSDNRVISILSASNQQLWLGTEDGGLNRFNFNNETFEQIKMDRISPFGLKSNNIRAIFEDNSQRIWLGTSGGGVFSFSLKGPSFSVIQLEDEKSGVVENQDVYSIIGDGGVIWIGTNGSGLFQGILKPKSTAGRFPEIQSFRHIKLESEIVHALCYDSWGRLWAGTLGGGLSLIEFPGAPDEPRIINFNINHPSPHTVSYNDIRCLYNDKRGNLWIGTAGGGLDKIVLAKKGEYYFEHYNYDKEKKWSLSNNDVRAITEDNSGNIWIGTAYGLNKLSSPGNNSKFETFYADPGEKSSLSGNWINALYAGQEGLLWVGTDAGLNKIDIKTNEITVYTENDGLVNNVIKGIFEDEQGNLWITSVNGISMFSKLNGTFYNFYESDGLLSNEFNTNAVYNDQNGNIFIGGTQGVNYFSPRGVLQHDQINALHLTNFKLFNHQVKAGEKIRGRILLQKDISIQKKLNLKYNENSFSIEFAALDYANAEKITYQYMLEGFNKNWQETNAAQRIATYTNLSGGTYTFRVKAITGIPGDRIPESSIQIHIDHPLWLRWWAFVLYLSFVAFFIHAARRYYKNKAKYREDLRVANLEREKEHELNQLKQRFFMNISHELKTPLALIIGPLESIQRETDMPEKHKKYLSLIRRNANILSRLITQMIDFSKQEQGAMKLRVEKLNVVKFLMEVMVSFSDLAKQQAISFHLHAEPENIYAWIDGEKMEKIIFNLLSNAFKYTPENGLVDIHVSEVHGDKKELQIKVQDSGRGIKPEHHEHIFKRFYQVNADDEETGTGIGLALVKELVELHHGEISVESGEGEGSCFTIQIPLDEQSCQEDIKVVKQHISVPEAGETDTNIEIQGDNEDAKPFVLVVEDNYDLCSYMQSVLSEKYHVNLAHNGEDGLQKALEIIPDIIVSDVMMPKMDGITFCNKIKNDISVSHVPVILLTAKSGKENVITGYMSGADDYIEKPFDTDILLARMEAILENRNLIWERIQKIPIKKITDQKVTKLDREFLEKLEKKVEENMASADFSVEELGRQIGMSRATLYRKVKGLTGKTAIEYIRMIRLNKAMNLLQNNSGNHVYIAEKVGFSDINYFRKCFKKQFEVAPEDI